MIRFLLLPLSYVCSTVMFWRAKLYARGIFRSVSFELPVVVVGNLQAGGSGKTPMVIHLLEELSSTYPLGMLSRGYGRRTRGFKLVNNRSTAEEVGDEPLLVYKRFKGRIPVAVGEQRILAIPSLLLHHKAIQALILDDAFQHLPLKASVYILLSTFDTPFFQDYPFPAGYLREGRGAASRAHAMVYTKCPSVLDEPTVKRYVREAKKYAGAEVTVFFYTLQYQSITPVLGMYTNVWLISGIANSRLFEEEAGRNLYVKGHSRYRDHHTYTLSDIQKCVAKALAAGAVAVVTTEKDYVKLSATEFATAFESITLHYLPMNCAPVAPTAPHELAHFVEAHMQHVLNQTADV